MTRGEKLRKLRNDLGYTQAQVLEKLPISINKNTLSNAEKDDTNISNEVMEILANFYNVSLDYLKKDDIENTSNTNIEINKELGLTDSAIEAIKNIPPESRDIFNYFLSNMDLKHFLKSMDDLKKYKQQLKKDYYLSQIVGLEKILDYYKKTNSKEELKNIFDYFENLSVEFKEKIIENQNGEYMATLYYTNLKLLIDKYLNSETNSENEISIKDFYIDCDYYREKISYSKYLCSSFLVDYLNKIEGINSFSDLEPDETVKKYLKEQEKLIKSKKIK